MAISPAIMGRKKVHARRINVNFQPNKPTSNGNRVNASNDQPVIKATMVPTLAPVRKSPAAMGKVTKGPPGVKPPIAAPIKTPRKPDSAPTHRDIISVGARTWIKPAIIKAKISNGQ